MTAESRFVLECFLWICFAIAIAIPIKFFLEMGGTPDDGLEGHYQIQRSRVINHPEYASPVLLTEYGWAKRGHETNWYKKEITQIGVANE